MAYLLQWVIFLAMVAAIAFAAMRVARWRGFGPRGQRATGITVAIVAFLLLNIPNLVNVAGGYYFEHLCKSEAGEFIYKSVDGVEGFYLMRRRDPRDYIDRVYARDIPEDPYGHTNLEAQHPELLFIGPPWRTYRFLETPAPTGSKGATERYRRFSGYQQDGSDPSFVEQFGYAQVGRPMITENVATLKSRYGVTWAGLPLRFGETVGVYGGETVVKDLRTDEVLARRRGFAWVRGRGGVCPPGKDDFFLYKFVSKVLKPLPPEQHGPPGAKQ
jgi:hypothetical protein